MKPQNQAHLQEEQIIRAVIDEQELDGADRQHILKCRVCREKIAWFKDKLEELGENAVLAVPPLKKNITLPSEELTPASNKSGWLPTFGVAAMACLALFFYFLGMESMEPGLTPYQGAELLLEDEYLMEEIFEMVENPLSDTLYEITGDSEGFDEDFLQFIVPDIQEDSQSKYFIQGGIKQC